MAPACSGTSHRGGSRVPQGRWTITHFYSISICLKQSIRLPFVEFLSITAAVVMFSVCWQSMYQLCHCVIQSYKGGVCFFSSYKHREGLHRECLYTQVDELTKEDVEQSWLDIFQPSWDRARAVHYLDPMPAGCFVVRGSSTKGSFALSVRKQEGTGSDGVWNGMLVESKQGVYLKFSELIGPTMKDVIGVMLVNADRAIAAGVPDRLLLPMDVDMSSSTGARADTTFDSAPAAPPTPSKGGGYLEPTEGEEDYDSLDDERSYDEAEPDGMPPTTISSGNLRQNINEEPIYGSDEDDPVYDECDDGTHGSPARAASALCGRCVRLLCVGAKCGCCMWLLCVAVVFGSCVWLLRVAAVCGGCVLSGAATY
eukprot:m.291635 g.291635  ORF g.291635 m.291635 type:complete len:369 (-) comp19981_c0_seq6:174-1280(-)